MPTLKEAFIGFDLTDGITLEKARSIAEFMNEILAGVSMTIFDTHQLYNQRVGSN